MRDFPPSHVKLRNVVNGLLGSDTLLGKLFMVDKLASSTYHAAQLDGQLLEAEFIKEMKTAYNVKSENTEPIVNDDSDHIVYGKATRDGNIREAFVGRFESDQSRASATRNYNPPRNINISKEARGALIAFFKARHEKNKKKSKKKKEESKEKTTTTSTKKRKQPQADDTEEEQQKKRQKEEEDKEAERLALQATRARLLIKAESVAERRRELDKELAGIREEISRFDVQLGEESTRPSPVVANEGGKTFYYLLDGRAGKFQYEGGTILASDITDNYQPLPEKYGDEERHNDNREKREYTSQSHGASQYWLPPGASGEAKNKMGQKEDAHETVKDLSQLFRGKQTKIPWEARRYAAAFAVQAYGASDEGVAGISVGWTKTLLEAFGMTDISAIDIARAVPVGKTWSRDEARLASECVMVVLDEILEDGATQFALMTDHGKRSGLEHFVKILIWCGWADKEKTQKTIKFHCLDVDSSYHDAEGCARAVEKSLEIVSGGVGTFKVTAITGDAGGGGAVQHLLPALVRLGVVDTKAVKINCIMHALNKCIECAGQDTFGLQGRGRRTPFQLLFVFNQLWKVIKEEGGGKSKGTKYLDEMYAQSVNKLQNDSEWQTEAKENMHQHYQLFLQEIEKLEDLEDDSGIDNLVKYLTETPKNIQDPVFSRWRTVMSTANVVTKFWTQIYFVAVAVMQNSAKDSYLYTLSSTLLSLMNERSREESTIIHTDEEDNNEGGTDDLEEQASSSSDDDDDDEEPLPPLQKGETPTFYAMLLFFCAFGSAYFDDMFNWTMKDDPILGVGSFGQTARHCVERCYIMHKLLCDLENDDGWKKRNEFKQYRRALDGIAREANGKGVGRKFFDKAATVFFQRFRYVFEKHVAACWRSDSILHYILGGHPVLAKEFARWLVDYKVMQEAGDADGEDLPDGEAFKFKDSEIHMGPSHHRHLANKQVWVKTDDAMEYITAEADRGVIMQSPFVVRHWKDIEKLAMCEGDVDIFKKQTWGMDTNGNPYDFSRLQDVIWEEVAIHASHQQRCENFVQLAALVSKTNVGEKRRTLRAIILSSIIRPFHIWAKQKLDERHGKTTRRVEDTNRGELLIEFMGEYIQRIENAILRFNKQQRKDILERLTDTDEKTSSRERQQKLDAFVSSLSKKRKKTKAEEPTGVVDQPVLMTGGIVFKYLTMSRSCSNCNMKWKKRIEIKCTQRGCCMAAVHAELHSRGIELTREQRKKLTIVEKRHKIRDDVGKNLNTGDRAKEGFDITSVRHFQPKSKLMKGLTDMCETELNKEKGIDM